MLVNCVVYKCVSNYNCSRHILTKDVRVSAGESTQAHCRPHSKAIERTDSWNVKRDTKTCTRKILIQN